MLEEADLLKLSKMADKPVTRVGASHQMVTERWEV